MAGTLPLAIVAVVGVLYLRSIPTSTGDVKLIAVLGAAGVLFGLAAAGQYPDRMATIKTTPAVAASTAPALEVTTVTEVDRKSVV